MIDSDGSGVRSGWAISRGGASVIVTTTLKLSESVSPSSSSTVQVYATCATGAPGVVPFTAKPFRVSHDGNDGDSV